MASELSPQARNAREKLRTNLMSLNNASIRAAAKVQSRSRPKKTSNKNKNNTRKWIWMYIVVIALALISLTSLILVIDPYGVISQFYSFIKTTWKLF